MTGYFSCRSDSILLSSRTLYVTAVGTAWSLMERTGRVTNLLYVTAVGTAWSLMERPGSVTNLLYVTAVGTAWSLMERPDSVTNLLFENQFLSWQCIHSCSHFGPFERNGKCLVAHALVFTPAQTNDGYSGHYCTCMHTFALSVCETSLCNR